MSSVLLLVLLAFLLVVPGVPACVVIFGASEGSVVTRLAAMFGLGYAVSGGCAFLLSAVHLFHLAAFVPVWLVVTAALWAWAVRTGSVRGFWQSVVADIRGNKVALGVGALVFVAFMVIMLRYLFVLDGPGYIYYLNGLEIANGHGVPLSTLEYGQNWPPATDKIYLDAFTGSLILFNHNAAAGLGVLLVAATAGSFLGLWATAWELGLRRTGVLLPVLYMANLVFFTTRIGVAYTDYRAEDFGRAVAFCALAVGIAAVREQDKKRAWWLASGGGVILAAASGTHLIPVVEVVLALCLAGLAALIFAYRGRDRLIPVARLAGLGALAGVGGLAIRALAGGSFGLEGAQNQSGYTPVHTASGTIDPSAYLYGGSKIAANPALWDTRPWNVVQTMLTGSASPAAWVLWLMIGLAVVATAVLLVNEPLRMAAVTGFGLTLGTVLVALGFALAYHTYIDETFGLRRLSAYVPIGFLLLVVALAEYLLTLLGKPVPRVSVAVAAAAVVGMSAWLLPATINSTQIEYAGNQRTQLVNWVRTQTPCNARFLINQRTEGTFTALTGRYALLEGMGAFLRTHQLPYVVDLMLKAQKFFHFPMDDEGFLRLHHISYVVVAQGFQELGYQAPLGPPNMRQLNVTPYLQLVFSTRTIRVYKVVGMDPQPVSPLLSGPYLHCVKAPVNF
jgi:hypothetical protein